MKIFPVTENKCNNTNKRKLNYDYNFHARKNPKMLDFLSARYPEIKTTY